MQNITIKVRSLPIYHSDYLRGVFEYTELNKKEKQRFQEMLSLLCNLVDPDVPFEFLEFYINQERFFPSFIKTKECIQLLTDLHTNNIQINLQSELQQLTTDFSTSDTYSTLEKEKLNRIRLLSDKAKNSSYPDFFYHQIPVSEHELFSLDNGYKRIKSEYLPYLPFLDVSAVDFSNSNLVGLNLSNTNIKQIDFSSLYQKSIHNTDFSNVSLFGKLLEDIDASGANLCGTWLQINVDSVSLNETKLDDTLLFLSHDGRVISPDNQGFVLEKKKSNHIKLHF